jgi:hypothetical protein
LQKKRVEEPNIIVRFWIISIILALVAISALIDAVKLWNKRKMKVCSKIY